MIGAADVPELRTEEVVCEEYFKIESPWRRGKPKVDGKSHRTGEIALVMGVDKRKARRQRNVHLNVECDEAADISKRFGLRKSLTFTFVGSNESAST